MSAGWLFDATAAQVSLLCCDPSTVVGVVAYDAARDIALVRIDPPLRTPGTIPAKPMQADVDGQYSIVLTLPIKFEVGPAFSMIGTTIEQRSNWAGTGETLIFASKHKLVMSGSLVVNDEGYPVAVLNGWGGGSRDIGTPLTEILAMSRHDPIPLASFGPEHMAGQQQALAFLTRAQNLRNGGRLQQAHNDAMRSLEIDPANWRALYELGVLTDMMDNDLRGAEVFLKRSIDIEDEWSESQYSLGLIQYKRSQYTLAIESFQKALALDNSNPDTNQMLGICMMQMSKVAEARPFLEIAHQLEPDDYMYLGNLINCYRELNLNYIAIERSKVFVEKNPNDPEGHEGLGQLALSMRDPELAIEQYQWLDSNLPPEAETLVRLAFCQMETGDHLSAASTLDRLESIDPTHELIPQMRQRLQD